MIVVVRRQTTIQSSAAVSVLCFGRNSNETCRRTIFIILLKRNDVVEMDNVPH
jgi:hypothetical protein